MINCIAVDDEPKALEVIEIHCSKIPDLNLASSFTNPQKALDFLKENYIDMVFLDINMPEISGLDFIQKLQSKPHIVFTTAYSEYALESYEFEAVDYLLKPIVFDRFNKAIGKVRKLMQLNSLQNGNGQNNFIFIKDGYKQIRVNIDDILYIQSDGNYLNIVTTNEKVMARMTFRQLFEKFPHGNFIRTHNSYAVAMNHINKIEDNHIFIGEYRIPIGIRYRDNLSNLINQIN